MTFEQQFDRLEQLTSDLLDRLGGFESTVLNRQPAAGGWSVAQVLSHLIQAERLSVGYLSKKMQSPELIPKSGLGAAAKSRALGLFLKLPFKVSAPARSAEVPETAELQELEREWSKVRTDWRGFLESFPPELAGSAVYKHPVAGRLNLEQTLRFLIDHLRRHEGQIERALADAQVGAGTR